MAADARRPLTQQEFSAVLQDYFELERPIAPSDRLVEDLGFDSIQMFEILLLLEETGNHEVPDEVQAALQTVGDVYDVYLQYAGH
jgi:acyl carrier protein